MLRGALKEVGLLVLLNQAIERRSGPRAPGGRLQRAHRPPRPPQPAGAGPLGDPAGSDAGARGGWLRGGSDRGFLTLLQELGEVFGTANRVVLVDSSGGAVDRPSHGDGTLPGGPRQYVQLFQQLVERRFRP